MSRLLMINACTVTLTRFLYLNSTKQNYSKLQNNKVKHNFRLEKETQTHTQNTFEISAIVKQEKKHARRIAAVKKDFNGHFVTMVGMV